MKGRLSQSDAEFYALENSTTPTHVGSLVILGRPDEGLEYERLLATIEERLAEVPRYRQKVRTVPLGTGYAVWVGVGASLAVVYSFVTGQESITPLKVTFLLMVVGGIAGLKLVG